MGAVPLGGLENRARSSPSVARGAEVRVEPEELTAGERYLLCERLTAELHLPVPQPRPGLPQGIVRIGAVCVFRRGGA